MLSMLNPIVKYFWIILQKHSVFVTFCWLLSFFSTEAQHTPELSNYGVSDYKAHQQNWGLSQSPDQWMYFANTDGLLTFNGQQWSKHALPGQKIIRSVYCHGDKVYTGAFGEFGYWTKDECDTHFYHSLSDIIPDHSIDKEEIWHIIAIDSDIYFQSFSVLLRYDGYRMHKVKLPGSVMFLHSVGEKKVLQSIDDGLYEIIDDDHFKKIEGSDFFAGKTVTGIHLLDRNSETWLVATATDGIFTFFKGQIRPWNSNYQHIFESAQVNKVTIHSDGSFGIGTIRDGLLIFNQDKTLRYHFHVGNGLQNNTILAVLEDKMGNLWLGLDKGIAHIFKSDDVLTFKDIAGKLGTTYCLLLAGRYLYVGTNQGLYYSDQSSNDIAKEFKLIKGTQGQVWQLLQSSHGIICGHNNGTFYIDGDQAYKISNITGGWFSMMVDSESFIQGTYTGLIVFKRKGNQWVFSHRIDGYSEPVKKIIQKSENEFWVTGPNNGLTTLRVNKELNKVLSIKKYQHNDSFENVDLSFLDGNVYVFNGTHYYSYTKKSDLFSIDKTKSKFIIRNLDDQKWAKVYRDSVVFMDKKQRLKAFPFTVNKDYHSVTLLDKERVGICMAEGYAIVSIHDKIPIKQSSQAIKFLFKVGDQYFCQRSTDNTFPFNQNNGQIHFFTRHYQPYNQFYGRLLPLDEDWKLISNDGIYSYHYLAAGDYVFEVKNSSGPLGKLNFTILNPWYMSFTAWVIYFILFILLLYWAFKFFNMQLERQKSYLEKQNNRLLREKMIEMENERLHQDNILKSKDLANATMHLIQKNELIQEIKEEIIQIRKSGEPALNTKDFQQMLHHINENLTMQDDKNLFNANFEDVHADFLKKLKHDQPSLSADDLKLAAYLRMNLSSKEIAPLFNISIRGLENKRYRLRKKMNLSLDTNLSEFFQNYL